MAITSPSMPDHKSVPPRAFKVRWLAWLLVAAVSYGLVYAMHWDDRAVLWFKEGLLSKDQRLASVWLPGYQATIDAKVLPGMEDDEASDVAYSPATDTLFAVTGKNPFLVELSLTGDVLRKISLVGWSNPEGVTVLNEGLIAITDERKHLLSIIKVAAGVTSLDIRDATSYDLGPSPKKNKAFEGIAWDPRHQQLLLGEERPAAVFTWSSNGTQLLEGSKRKVTDLDLDMRNLSALSVDPRTGHLLALSADSHMLLELDENGKQVSFMALLAGMNGLKDTIPRAEGVALDERGTLYMVSEPNLFYAFRKQ